MFTTVCSPVAFLWRCIARGRAAQVTMLGWFMCRCVRQGDQRNPGCIGRLCFNEGRGRGREGVATEDREGEEEEEKGDEVTSF